MNKYGCTLQRLPNHPFLMRIIDTFTFFVWKQLCSIVYLVYSLHLTHLHIIICTHTHSPRAQRILYPNNNSVILCFADSTGSVPTIDITGSLSSRVTSWIQRTQIQSNHVILSVLRPSPSNSERVNVVQ